MLLIHLEKLQSGVFSDSLSTEEPISFLLVVSEDESCKLTLKAKQEEDNEEEAVTVIFAAAQRSAWMLQFYQFYQLWIAFSQ